MSGLVSGFAGAFALAALRHRGEPAVAPVWNQGILMDRIRARLLNRDAIWRAVGNDAS